MWDYLNSYIANFISMLSFFNDEHSENKKDEEYELIEDYHDYVLLRDKKTGEKVLERKE